MAGIYDICTKLKGKLSCEDLERFWGIQPPLILGGRIMLKSACVCSSLGLVLVLIGSKFTSFLTEKIDSPKAIYSTTKMKDKAYFLGSLLVFISGILVSATVIWYSVRIIDNFWSLSTNLTSAGGQVFPGQKYAFGPGLYFYGWGSGAILLLSGFSGLVSIFCSKSYENYDTASSLFDYKFDKKNVNYV